MASRPHATMDEQVLEVKELVQRTLEKQGLLDHVRALLRSAVFVAIDNENEDLALLHPNQKVATITKTHAGRVALELVRDFLEFYDLRQTLAVFNPETHAAGSSGMDRQALQAAMGFKLEPHLPALVQLVDRGPPTSPMMGSPPSVSPPVPYAMLDTYASQQQPPPPKQQSADDSPPAASYKQAAEHKLEVGRGRSPVDEEEDVEEEEEDVEEEGSLDLPGDEEEDQQRPGGGLSSADALYVARTSSSSKQDSTRSEASEPPPPPPAPSRSLLGPLAPLGGGGRTSGLAPLQKLPGLGGDITPPPPPGRHEDDDDEEEDDDDKDDPLMRTARLDPSAFQGARDKQQHYGHHADEDEEDEDDDALIEGADLDDDEDEEEEQLGKPAAAVGSAAWGRTTRIAVERDHDEEEKEEDEDEEEDEGVVLIPRAAGFQKAATTSGRAQAPPAPAASKQQHQEEDEEEDEIEYGGDFESDGEFDDVEELSETDEDDDDGRGKGGNKKGGSDHRLEYSEEAALSPRLEDSQAEARKGGTNEESGSLEASVVDRSVGGSSVLDHEVDFSEPVKPPPRASGWR